MTRQHDHTQVMGAYKREYEVMRSLRDGPRPLGRISRETGIPYTTTKKVLARLRDDGLVSWHQRKGWYLEDVA